MGWLRYTDDEIEVFHSAFIRAAEESLTRLEMDQSHVWIHHDANAHGGIPDFVLVDRTTGRYVLIVEIKKTSQAVHSLNYQYQTYNYARYNGERYAVSRPHYTMLTNMEESILFVFRSERHTPLDSRVLNHTYRHGNFQHDEESSHRSVFVNNLCRVIEYCISIGDEESPEYEVSIPVMISDLLHHVNSFPPVDVIQSPARAYFSSRYNEHSLLFVIRCLFAQWIVHHLRVAGHPEGVSLPELDPEAIGASAIDVGRLLEALIDIDFHTIFLDEGPSPSDYLDYESETGLRILHQYLIHLNDVDLEQLESLLHNDGFIDYLFNAIQGFMEQRRKGTVQTDYDLGRILASLLITEDDSVILDPCCGVGNLLSAAYDLLVESGIQHDTVCNSIRGIEVDVLQANLASMKLVLKNPANVSRDREPCILSADLFSLPERIESADVILMNPPFKRYESQDEYPLPSGYRDQVGEAIREWTGEIPVTVGGQTNLYHYYVEFVVSCAKPGAKIGVILDNKWYQNRYGRPLREFLHEKCLIDAIIEYPHHYFFEGAIVSTTLVLLRKKVTETPEHEVRLVRCTTDPRETDIRVVRELVAGDANIEVSDWSASTIRQTDLNPERGWKPHFSPSDTLTRVTEYPLLVELFDDVRGGRLEREETAKILSFPFRDWTQKGTAPRGTTSYRRERLPNGRMFQTRQGDPVSEGVLVKITELVREIPQEYRGFAIKRANAMGDNVQYALRVDNFSHQYADGSTDSVLEPPSLRTRAWKRGTGRHEWTGEFEQAIEELRDDPRTSEFMHLIENDLGLNEDTLPLEQIWADMREPAAGELIIPRMLRLGLRIHINPLAFDPSGPQMRVSSNFFTLRGLNTGDDSISREEGAYLITAFLLSTFGHLQFETYCNDREGAIRINKEQLGRIRVPVPAQIPMPLRGAIIEAFHSLPCPIDRRYHPNEIEGRTELDKLFAQMILNKTEPDRETEMLVVEAQNELNEWLRGAAV